MLRTFAVTFALLIGSSAFAAEDDVKKALKSLEGDWKAVKFVAGGEDGPADKIEKMSFTIKGDRIIPSDDPKDFATIKLDPTAKPATMDFKDTHNETSLGIYELDGDKLKLCFATGKEARPKEFKSPKGSKTVYIELKKVAK